MWLTFAGGHMRTNVLYMLKSMDKRDVGLQLALQCAPVITGIKVSNLFIIDKNMVEELYDIIDGTDISAFFLYEDEIKANILLYRKKELQQYLLRKENQKFIRNFGYESVYIDDLLPEFAIRFSIYQLTQGEFPHEMGILLGYPVEDVEGFISNNGKNELYTGYWKVYDNLPEKLVLFNYYEAAREHFICLLAKGMDMSSILMMYNRARKKYLQFQIN
jgi:hypothetical protein